MFHTQHHKAPIGSLTTTQLDELGLVVAQVDAVKGGYSLFKYVKFTELDTVAIRDGSVVIYDDVSSVQAKDTVTADVSAGSASLQAAGVVAAADVSGTFAGDSSGVGYGFIQIKGYHANVLTGGSVSVDDPIEAGTADGVAATQSGTYNASHPLQFLGTALATDSGSPTTSPCYIWGLMDC